MKQIATLSIVVTCCAFAQTLPTTGRDVPSLAPYETALKTILQKWSIPGAALAITDQGRLVYARGIGYADKEAGIAVQPFSLFRLASISKTFTGMTIVKLAEEGKLNLDAKFMDVIPNITPIPGFTFDTRIRNITVRMLLQHTGGWDKDVPSDWTLQFNAASKALSVQYSTLTPDMMCRYAISQQLNFDPGTKYAYSQTGYLLLGRIIEKITGKKYDDVVREKILSPAGASTIHLGHSLLSQREPDEVKYYDYPTATLQLTTPVVPGAVPPTPRQYGNYWVEQAESYGGWIGNAIDLMKYINTLEGRRGPAILSQASLNAIVVRPSITPTGEFVSLTWRIDQLTTGGAHWWHSGGATGTRNILARRQNLRDWVVLMNSRPLDEDTIVSEIFTAFAKAETQVTSWPTNDLFADFAGATLSTDVQTLTFNYVLGSAAPASQSIQVTAAPSAVNFTVTTSAPWLAVDRLSGATPASLKVTASPTGLQPGTYNGSVTISAPQASNGSRIIPVTFTVGATQGFTAIRNSASLMTTITAAPASRIVLEASEIGDGAAVTIGGVIATLVDTRPGRLDLVVPAEVPLGDAEIALATAAGKVLRDRLQIEAVSPGLFTASGDGLGVPLASLLAADGSSTPTYDCSSGACLSIPIDVSSSANVQLQFAATGLRGQTDLIIQIGDQVVDLRAIDVSDNGVDLVTITLPPTLAGLGDVDLIVTAAGRTSNPVRISIL